MKKQKQTTPIYAKQPSIIDEVCTCGDLKSQHNARTHKVGAMNYGVSGHGPCHVPGCGCTQFSWKAFVYADGSKG